MTDKNKTAIAAVVDRSGSMWSIMQDAQDGLNAFIADQQKQPGKTYFRLTEFDDRVDTIVPTRDINEVLPYVLKPRGSTALLDALGKTINEFGAELRRLPESERPDTVVVVVVTDGGENSSREFSREKIFEMINHQRDKYNWDFVFLAANQDAIQTGGALGFRAASSMTFDTKNVGGTYAMASSYVNRTRLAGANTSVFTEEERAAAVK